MRESSNRVERTHNPDQQYLRVKQSAGAAIRLNERRLTEKQRSRVSPETGAAKYESETCGMSSPSSERILSAEQPYLRVNYGQ